MNKHSVAIIGALVLIAVLPQLLITGADAKMLPKYNSDYTRNQVTVMLVIPAALTGAIALVLGLAKMN